MSLKYERIKKLDRTWPAPLRWLNRLFSSITLAVCLMVSVMLYGLFASVPIAFIAKGAIIAAVSLCTIGIAVLAAIWTLRAAKPSFGKRCVAALVILIPGAAAAWVSLASAKAWWADVPWFEQTRATVLYRLPAFEMTELQFYSWWPLKLILALFVTNMIWATLTRIEFKFVNIGVLTVHTGIVTVAVGTFFYGTFKVEGDMLLFRKDLGGTPVSEFYDGVKPALFVTATTRAADGTLTKRGAMIPLPELPRYNDYLKGSPRDLNIRLSDMEPFVQTVGPNVRAVIRDFIAYGSLKPVWIDAGKDEASPFRITDNPAIRIAMGDEAKAGTEHSALLVSGVPGERYIEQETWAVEYLHNPSDRRLRELQTPIEGQHGLLVEIPSWQFNGVYVIEPGKTITLGDTGYKLTVEQIGDYGMSFVTRGYERASDTRAMVRVETPNPEKKMFRRIVMHRFPERSQDFVPLPPGTPPPPGVGPMGKRSDPDPVIRLTYLDDSKIQYRIITMGSVTAETSFGLLVRIPGYKPQIVAMASPKFPLPGPTNRAPFIHITERMTHAIQGLEPVPTPKDERVPKDEGTFLHALLPVDLEVDRKQSDGSSTVWKRRVWLTHMRYPTLPQGQHRPESVDVPGVGRIEIGFSRQSYALPFALELEAFEMQPVPGTRIPRDFVASLKVVESDPAAAANTPPITTHAQARLNNPLIYRASHGPMPLRKVKISQTGWDPGDRNDPQVDEKDKQGRYINQQRYSIMGIGNNVAIRVIFVGACLIVAGIPWAFYIKPLLVQRQKRRLQAQLAVDTKKAKPEPEPAVSAATARK